MKIEVSNAMILHIYDVMFDSKQIDMESWPSKEFSSKISTGTEGVEFLFSNEELWMSLLMIRVFSTNGKMETMSTCFFSSLFASTVYSSFPTGTTVACENWLKRFPRPPGHCIGSARRHSGE